MNTETLQKNLSAITEFTVQKNTLPILDSVLVTQSDSLLTLRATDLESSIQISSNGSKKAEPFSLAISAKTFANTVKGESEETFLRLDKKQEDKIIIDVGRAHYRLNVDHADNFPSLLFESKLKELPNVCLKSFELISVLEKCSPYMSIDSTRYAICGLHLEPLNGGSAIRFVATDGHTIGVTTIDLDSECAWLTEMKPSTQATGHVIWPREGVVKLLSVLKKLKPECLYFSRRKEGASNFSCFSFAVENGSKIEIFLREIDGRYPNWRCVLSPDPVLSSLSISLEDLIPAVAKTQKITSDRARTIKFSFGELRCSIGASSPGKGEATIELKNHAFEGDSIEIGISGKYLDRTIKALSGAAPIRIDMRGPLGPVHFTNAPSSSASFEAIIMPMRFE